MASTKEHTSIRISKALLELIDKEAARDKRSRSKLIEILLWNAVMEFDADPAPRKESPEPELLDEPPSLRFKISSSLSGKPEAPELAIRHSPTCKCLMCKPPKP